MLIAAMPMPPPARRRRYAAAASLRQLPIRLADYFADYFALSFR
jgi:hypothetical protein